MDPDLVRQQEEAEREAIRLAGLKPGTPAALAVAVTYQAIAASAAQGSEPILPGDAGLAPYDTQRAGPHSDGQSSAPSLAGAIDAGGWAAPRGQPYPRRHTARLALWYFSEFLSFGLAGAMLGGVLGIAAANYMQLPAEAVKLAIFGPAGFFAIVCALASFFTGGTAQPRASSGT
jgi:hypothetical protein